MAKIAQAQKKETVSSKISQTVDDLKEIERLAYQFFVERGYQHGHDREDWLRAESIVRSRRK